jgi:predicted GIY-YIG superfamily endonuclease
MANISLRDFSYFRMWPRDFMNKKGVGGRLLIKDAEELDCHGVYVLYKGDEPYYIGRANRLMSRLHDHSNKVTDIRYAHWDHFSAFALAKTVKNPKQKIAELEAILIAAMPRASNKSTPRFGIVKIPKSLRSR